MINMSELITDPDFAQPITIFRQHGRWVKGKWTVSPETTLLTYGVVTVANVRDVDQLPEADRIKGMMAFHTTSEFPIFVTHIVNGESSFPDGGTSDQLMWRGERCRILQVYPYNDYGYTKALGARMVGA